MLQIVGIYAVILGFMAAVLKLNVIRSRVAHQIEKGDGGVPQLYQVIRAHGNFTEQAPMLLILLACAEAAGARPLALHGLGITIVLSRLASSWGLSKSAGLSLGRQVGAGLGILVLVATSFTLLLALVGVR